MATLGHPRSFAFNADVIGVKSFSAAPTVRTNGSAIQQGDCAWSDGTADDDGFGDQGEGLYGWNGTAWQPVSPLSADVMLKSSTQIITASGAKDFTGTGSLLRRGQEAKTHFIVESRTTTAQPGSPTVGHHYLLPASKTGAAWGGYTAGNLAAFIQASPSNTWEEIAVAEGFSVYVKDENQLLVYDGSAWVAADTFKRLLESNAGGSTFDVSKRITEITKTRVTVGGALVLRNITSAQYSIAVDTPSAGSTRFTITDAAIAPVASGDYVAIDG